MSIHSLEADWEIIARLTRERDEIIKERDREWKFRAERAEAQVARLTAREAVLVAALEELALYIPAGSDEGDAMVVLSYVRQTAKAALSSTPDEALNIIHELMRCADFEGIESLVAEARVLFGLESRRQFKGSR